MLFTQFTKLAINLWKQIAAMAENSMNSFDSGLYRSNKLDPRVKV